MQRPLRTVAPASRARSASSEASRVLPIPASPAINTVEPRPSAAAASAASRRRSSSARPTRLGGALRLHVAFEYPPIRRPRPKDKAVRPMRGPRLRASIERGMSAQAIDAEAFNAFEAAGWNERAGSYDRFVRVAHQAGDRAAARRGGGRGEDPRARSRDRSRLRGRGLRRTRRDGGRRRRRGGDGRARPPAPSAARVRAGERRAPPIRRRLLRRGGRELPHPPSRAAGARCRRDGARARAGWEGRALHLGRPRADAPARRVPRSGARSGRRAARAHPGRPALLPLRRRARVHRVSSSAPA